MPGLTEFSVQEIVNRCFNPNTNSLNTSIRTITVPSGDTSPGLAITPQGTNPAIRIYNPGASELEFLSLLWDTNVAIIQVGATGAGTGRSLRLGNNRGSDYLTLNADGSVSLISKNNGDITLTPNGTGQPKILGDLSGATLNDTGLVLQDTNTAAIDVGAALLLMGYHTAQTSAAVFGQIAAGKENSTSGNYASYLRFATRANGGAVTEQMRIDSAGRVGVGVAAPAEVLQVDDAIAVSNNTEGSTGRLTRRSKRILTAALTGASVNMAFQIPSGARLLAAQFCVNTEITGATSWSAAFNTGSTTSLGSGYGLTVNTKVNQQVVDELTTNLTDITLTAAGSNFTAGVIEGVVYYEELTSMANV